MDAPNPSPSWTTNVTAIIATPAVALAAVAVAWKGVVAPFKRISAVEKKTAAVSTRVETLEKDHKMTASSVQTLEEAHGQTRDLLARQPTRDDLRQVEERMAERMAHTETQIMSQIRLVADLVSGGARHR